MTSADYGIEKIKELRGKVSWEEIDYRRFLLILAVFLLVFATLAIDFIPDRLAGIRIGKPSEKTVKAPRDVQFVDFEKTAALREKAAAAVKSIYNHDVAAEARSMDAAQRLFSAVEKAKASQAVPPRTQASLLAELVDRPIRSDLLQLLVTRSHDDLLRTERELESVLNRRYAGRITAGDLDKQREELEKMARTSPPSVPATIRLATALAASFLEPNYVFDREVTERLRQEAAASIEPVVVSKLRSETIVREGEIVTNEHVRILRALGLLSRGIDIWRLLGTAIVTVMTLSALGIYLHSHQRGIYASPRLLAVLALVLLVVLLTAKFVTPFFSSYLIPVAAAAMLTTLLFSAELAVVMVLVSTLLSGLVAGGNYQFMLVALTGGLLSIFSVSHVRHRIDLARAGLTVTLVFAALAVAATLISGAEAVEILRNLGWGIMSGLSASVLTIGALPFLEKMFGVTTDVRLVELSAANQPLLRELMMKAPGTYNHSVTAANLAESAAEHVEANPLLARVGAYYHDIGKMKRPLFFVENQVGGENPHDRTNPNLSCLIITSHVKEGVELARKHGLPKEIVAIIREHHGTGLVSYFFQRAKENLMKEEVCEADFRYTGARPRSREAALVMLADSVEAAARTISRPSPARLEQLVKKIVQSKLDDDQLGESNLTLNDLGKITRSFAQVLTSMYHTRIEYPAQAASLGSLSLHGDSR